MILLVSCLHSSHLCELLCCGLATSEIHLQSLTSAQVQRILWKEVRPLPPHRQYTTFCSRETEL